MRNIGLVDTLDNSSQAAIYKDLKDSPACSFDIWNDSVFLEFILNLADDSELVLFIFQVNQHLRLIDSIDYTSPVFP